MVSRFVIEADPEKHTYEPVDLHVKMERRLPDGSRQPVAIDLVSIEMDRQGLITLTPKGAETDEPILVYEVQLTDELLGSADFATKIEKPIRVTFTARPEEAADATQAAPLKQDCDIEIRAPGAVHWTVGDDLTTRDLPLEIDADGVSELMLSVRYEEWDPQLRKFEYDPSKVEFTHWTGPRLPPDVFNAHPDDLPWETTSEENNRDHSRWASLKELPDPGHVGLDPPVDSYIRVRVWPRGSIIRVPSAIKPKEGARMLAEQQVPITLRPARQIVELVDPTEPIAADGLAHPLRLRFLRERDRTPVKKGVYSFEIERGVSYRGGKLTEDQGELKEEHNGELTLEYTPAELTYEPGKSFTEQLLVYRGNDDKRQLLATIPLYLSPKVELRIQAEKAGLVFEPYEISIPAGSAPHKIRGSLVFEVYHRESGDDMPFDVAHAHVKAFVGEAQVDREVLSDTAGTYEVVLPELEEGLRKLPEERRIHTLAKDSERPDCTFHEDADTVIRFYEDKTDRFAPWLLYTGELVTKVKTHRVLLGSQIAANPEDQLARAMSGTDLLRTGTTFGTTYLGMFNSAYGTAGGQLTATLLEAISLIAAFVPFQKVAGGAGGVAKELSIFDSVANKIGGYLDDAGTWAAPIAERLGTWFTGTLGPMLASAARSVPAYLDDAARMLGPWVTDGLRAMIQQAAARWNTIAELAEQVAVSRGRRALEIGAEILKGLLTAIGTLFKAIVHALLAAGAKVVSWVLSGTGFVLGHLGAGAGRFLDYIGFFGGSGWVSQSTRELARTSGAKFIEEIVKAIFGKIADLVSDGQAALLGSEGSKVMSVIARAAVAYLHDNVAKLNVVEDPTSLIEDFRSSTVSLLGKQQTFNEWLAWANEWVIWAEKWVLILEVVAIVVSIFVSMGLAAAPAVAFVDKWFSAAKMLFVRAPALIGSVGLAFAIPSCYGWRTAALAGGGASTSVGAGATP